MTRPHLPARADAMLRVNQTPDSDVRAKDTQPADDPQAKAARVLHTALKESDRSSAEAAFALKVSDSLVNRMRSVDARETISLVQIFVLCRDLGPRFAWEYHKAFHREEKLAKQALRETVQALSLVGVGIDGV